MTSFRYIGGLKVATLLCFFFILDRPACADGVLSRYQVVSRAEIIEAMRQCDDYDPTATTNGARFQGEMILYLAQKARARDPQGLPLFIGYENWFQAFMEVTARAEDAMPQYAQLLYQYEQNIGRPARQAGSVFVHGYALNAESQSNQSSGDDLSTAGFWKLGCL